MQKSPMSPKTVIVETGVTKCLLLMFKSSKSTWRVDLTEPNGSSVPKFSHVKNAKKTNYRMLRQKLFLRFFI